MTRPLKEIGSEIRNQEIELTWIKAIESLQGGGG